MSGFLYFIDGLINPLTEKHISECALDYAFERKPQSGRLAGRTPSGADGCILCDETRGCELAYKPDLQTWRKMPRPAEYAGPDAYIGFYNDKRPGPESLARAKQLDGGFVRLADTKSWLIPQLRFWSDENGFVCKLRGRAGIDDSGNWTVGGFDEQQQQLNVLADRLYQGMVVALAGNAAPLTTLEALDAVAQLIGANYVVSRVELGVLEVLPTDDDLMAACRIATDFDKANEWAQKKTEELAQAAGIG